VAPARSDALAALSSTAVHMPSDPNSQIPRRQLMQFNRDRGQRWTAPGELYGVAKQIPHNGREYRYRIKSVREEHGRTAGEAS
jgi:hypothetical protein